MKKSWAGEGARRLTRIRQYAFLRAVRHLSAESKRTGITSHERARREKQSRRDRAEHGERESRSVVAPENFSFLSNTEEMLRFVDDVRTAISQGFEPSLDMRAIRTLGAEAIMVLNSTVSTLVDRYQMPIRGTVPEDASLAAVLRRSGFYEHVSPPRGASYDADRGIVCHEGEQVVDTPVAERLVHFATRAIYGQARDHQPTYAAIGEFMQNTFDHADQTVGRARWWASVFHDDAADVVHFCFLDIGLGIFGSRPVRMLDRLRRASDLADDPTFLMNLFEGRLASRTGLPWRGQGLPRVYKRVLRGDLKEMTVITNRVKGHLDTRSFVQLGRAFQGTLYHWEMRRE